MAQMDCLEDYDELEDGEISSDEDDLTTKANSEIQATTQSSEVTGDYEILPRPIALARRTLDREPEGSSRTLGIDPHYHHQQQQPARPTRPTPMKSQLLQNQYDDDNDDDDKSSASSADSDEEGPTGKKSKRMFDPQFNPSKNALGGIMDAEGNPNRFEFTSGSSTSTAAVGGEEFKNQAMVFQQKRKPNNIWSSVIQDELVSDIFGKVNVAEYDDKHVLIDRGPESFSVTYKSRPPVRQRSDSSSLSSGGLTDDELDYLRGLPDEEGSEKPSSSKSKGPDAEEPLQSFGPKRFRRKGDAYKRGQRRKQKNRMVQKMRKKPAHELGIYIAEKLSEPKSELITRAIELLGKEACIALFLKTMKIERRGGLMIINQERRRTAGGVFLYLLRGDRRFSRSLVNKVFSSEKQEQTVSRKRQHKTNRLKRKASLEKKKEEHEQMNKMDPDNEAPNPSMPVAFQVSQDLMDDNPDDEESTAEEGEDSDVDSDEFYGIRGQDGQDPMYDEDCIEINCDPSDLN